MTRHPIRALAAATEDAAALASLVALAVLAGCAGAGEEDDGDEEVGILASYEFRLGGPLAGSAGPSALHVASPELDVVAAMDLFGSHLCDQETEVCRLQVIHPQSTVAIDDRTVPEVAGDFTVTVDDTWVFNPLAGDRPAAGSAIVRPAAAGADEVRVHVAACEAGAGVSIHAASAGSTCRTWDELDALLDGDPTPAEALAARGWSAVELTVGQADLALAAFEYIARGGQGTLPCEAYGASWPGGPSNPGWFTFRWLDDSQDGTMGPGDSFRQEFTECWTSGPAAGVGTLVDGTVEFVGYTEVVERGMITRIGFEGETLAGRVGGLAYDAFTIVETAEAGGVVAADDPVVLDGRFVLAFFE